MHDLDEPASRCRCFWKSKLVGLSEWRQPWMNFHRLYHRQIYLSTKCCLSVVRGLRRPRIVTPQREHLARLHHIMKIDSSCVRFSKGIRGHHDETL